MIAGCRPHKRVKSSALLHTQGLQPHLENAKEEKIYAGSMDAITKGTKDGLNIAVNVAAILISNLALV